MPLRRDVIAVWHVEEQGQGWSSQVVHAEAPPLPEGSGRLTCTACNDSASGLLIAAGMHSSPLLSPDA